MTNRSADALVVLAGSAHPPLAAAVARELGAELGARTTERFPDGELHVRIDAARVDGRRVAVIQPTSNVASEHLLELLLLADACRRSGARSVSAVIPYFGYARHDKRKHPGEALGVRVVADALATGHFERIVTVDPHGNAVEAALDAPLEALSAVPLLADALRQRAEPGSVVVAPDLGAVRLAREYARRLGLPFATVQKVRKSGTEVEVEHVAGDVRGLRPILVDDMIATGGTIVAAAQALAAMGARREIVVAATHAVLTPGTMDRLRAAGLSWLVVTDTIAPPSVEPSTAVVSVARLLAGALRYGTCSDSPR